MSWMPSWGFWYILSRFDFRVSTVSVHPRKASPIFPRRLSDQKMAWRLNLLELNTERGPAYLMSSDRFSVTYDVDDTILAESNRRRGFWKVVYQSVLFIKSYTDGHTRIPCPSYRVSFVPALECTSHYSSDDSRWDDLLHGVVRKENFGQSPVAFQPISSLRPALSIIPSPDSVLQYNTKSAHP
jgi:hypothetical protein